MFLSREIEIKLCQIYRKIHIYIKFCIEIVGLNRSYSENMQPIRKRIYYLRLTSPELLPMVVQFSGHVSLSVSRDQYTAFSLVEILVT